MENLTAANFQQTFDNQTLDCKPPLTFCESLILAFWPLFFGSIFLPILLLIFEMKHEIKELENKGEYQKKYLFIEHRDGVTWTVKRKHVKIL